MKLLWRVLISVFAGLLISGVFLSIIHQNPTKVAREVRGVTKPGSKALAHAARSPAEAPRSPSQPPGHHAGGPPTHPLPERTLRVLQCIRGPWNGSPQESNGRYDATGKYRGAYQFLQSTFNGVVARHQEHLLTGPNPDGTPRKVKILINLDPATIWPADQDLLAALLFNESGLRPWPNREECAKA